MIMVQVAAAIAEAIGATANTSLTLVRAGGPAGAMFLHCLVHPQYVDQLHLRLASLAPEVSADRSWRVLAEQAKSPGVAGVAALVDAVMSGEKIRDGIVSTIAANDDEVATAQSTVFRAALATVVLPLLTLVIFSLEHAIPSGWFGVIIGLAWLAAVVALALGALLAFLALLSALGLWLAAGVKRRQYSKSISRHR